MIRLSIIAVVGLAFLTGCTSSPKKKLRRTAAVAVAAPAAGAALVVGGKKKTKAKVTKDRELPRKDGNKELDGRLRD